MSLEPPDAYERRATATQGAAAKALTGLLELAPRSRSDAGLVRRVARFLARTYSGSALPFALFEPRAVNVAISDVLLCINVGLQWPSGS